MAQKKAIYIWDFKNCEKIFTTTYSLARHSLTHNKKKNHIWKQCNKAFSFKQNLIEHEFVHTGELPYVCNVNGCTERFRQRGKLSLHRQSHKNYQKRNYRSHVAINEGDTKPVQQFTQTGEPANYPRLPSNPLFQANSTPSMVPYNNNRYLLNEVWAKMSSVGGNGRYFNLNSNMPNGGYHLIRSSLSPMNIVSRPNQQRFGNSRYLPKLSVVLMPNNQLSCQFK